jgi:uncharacterized membrane protein YccF (DUF307 family)
MSRRLNTRNLITIVSVAVLVGTEILGASIALGWAVGGLLELGRDVTIGLTAACFILGLYGTWRFARHAARIEPIYTTER